MLGTHHEQVSTHVVFHGRAATVGKAQVRRVGRVQKRCPVSEHIGSRRGRRGIRWLKSLGMSKNDPTAVGDIRSTGFTLAHALTSTPLSDCLEGTRERDTDLCLGQSKEYGPSFYIGLGGRLLHREQNRWAQSCNKRLHRRADLSWTSPFTPSGSVVRILPMGSQMDDEPVSIM